VYKYKCKGKLDQWRNHKVRLNYKNKLIIVINIEHNELINKFIIF